MTVAAAASANYKDRTVDNLKFLYPAGADLDSESDDDSCGEEDDFHFGEFECALHVRFLQCSYASWQLVWYAVAPWQQRSETVPRVHGSAVAVCK